MFKFIQNLLFLKGTIIGLRLCYFCQFSKFYILELFVSEKLRDH